MGANEKHEAAFHNATPEDLDAVVRGMIEQAESEMKDARKRLLGIIDNALQDVVEGVESVAITDDWTLCVSIDGVDLALTVTPA